MGKEDSKGLQLYSCKEDKHSFAGHGSGEMNTVVPQVNIFRALTFLADKSTPLNVYRLPYSTSTHREASAEVEWHKYMRRDQKGPGNQGPNFKEPALQ